MSKPRIFVREAARGQFRYTVVAAQGGDIHFHKDRFSKAELELLAREMGAELVSITQEEEILIDEEEQVLEGEEEPEE